MAVSFNGTSKLIQISGMTTVRAHTDLYVPFINWSYSSGNMQYLSAFTSGGYTPISATAYSDRIFTLINGWKLQFNGYSNGDPVYIEGGTLSNGDTEQAAPASGGYPAVTVIKSTYGTVTSGGGAGGDMWATDLSSYTTSGTAGKIMKDIKNNANLIPALL